MLPNTERGQPLSYEIAVCRISFTSTGPHVARHAFCHLLISKGFGLAAELAFANPKDDRALLSVRHIARLAVGAPNRPDAQTIMAEYTSGHAIKVKACPPIAPSRLIAIGTEPNWIAGSQFV
jgi:hypothetical protein